MKIQNTEVRSQKSEALREFARTHNAGSVIDIRRAGMGRDKARAERRFLRQHWHLLCGEAGSVSGDLMVWVCLAVMAVVGMIMLADLCSLRASLHDAKDQIKCLQFEVRTLTGTVGEVRQEFLDNPTLVNRKSAIVNPEGGAR